MTFSPPIFISVGDEYEKKGRGIPDRFKGRSFTTNPGKKGSGADTLFGKKFISMADGDRFVDPGYFDKKYRLENEKKKLTRQGFKYSSGTKQMGGAGTYYGCFAEKDHPKHLVEFAVTKRGEAPERSKPITRNMVTNPAKKGTYGFPNTTIGKGSEVKYISDPYEGEKRKEALSQKESSKRIVGPAFKGACKRGGFFDETNHGISRVYTIDKPLPARKVPKDDKKGGNPPLAWKPAGRLEGSIEKAPSYMEDPYELKEKLLREQRRKDQPKTVWKPMAGAKTLPTRPIKFVPA